MSREGLSSFITAAEHRLTIRQELYKTNNIEEILILARKYGFQLNHKDLKGDLLSESIETWFKKSKISPFKK